MPQRAVLTVNKHILRAGDARDHNKRTKSKPSGRNGQPVPTNGGRKPGFQQRTTRILKEAILLAAEQVGEDFKGRGGLLGYLKKVARTDMKSFVYLLGKVLPMQVHARLELENALREKYVSLSDARKAVADLGLPAQRLFPPAEVIEAEVVEPND